MAESTKIPAAKRAARRRRPLGAALAACWYLLVYTHLASFALARLAPTEAVHGCSCAATGSGSCCSQPHAAAAEVCELPDLSMGCHSGPKSTPASCVFAAPCADELPAAPKTAALTWPHLAINASVLQPPSLSCGLRLPKVLPGFSLASVPPDKVPKHLS